MSFLQSARDEPESALWDQLEEASVVMLAPLAGDGHAQPMAPFACRDEKSVFFFASAGSRMVRLAKPSLSARTTFMNAGGTFQASLNGTLFRVHRPDIVDRFWSPVAGAWFAGKDDPDLAVLAFMPADAAIWASSDSSIRFGWEIAKANLGERAPDIGFHTSFTVSRPLAGHSSVNH